MVLSASPYRLAIKQLNMSHVALTPVQDYQNLNDVWVFTPREPAGRCQGVDAGCSLRLRASVAGSSEGSKRAFIRPGTSLFLVASQCATARKRADRKVA